MSKKPQRAKVDLNKRHHPVNARYEAAQRTAENASLWGLVDALSAAAANSPDVRRVLRNRSRYEYDNSPDVQAIADAYVADFIGDRIGLQLGNDDLSGIVELEFLSWARRSKFLTKLRQMATATYKDGESFALFTTNDAIRHAVKLDIQPIEAEMVESYFTGTTAMDRGEIDGIRFDSNGNPTQYRVLDTHPGDYRATANFGKTAGRWINAEHVLHMMNWSKLRPGQVRGVPETTSIISLPGLLRQFIAATITSAKTAAELSAVMQTNLVPETADGKCAAELEALSEISIGRGSIVSLPEGWELSQLRAEHPTANFKEFCDFLKSYIGRPSNMPRNVAIGDSSGYNYASGRLDHQTWDRCQAVKRDDLICHILDRVYYAFVVEFIPALQAAGKVIDREAERRLINAVPEWTFRKRGHVDPGKEAAADKVRLDNKMLTHSDYWAEQGEDGHRKVKEWLKERVDMEAEWQRLRVAAGLDPAPMPQGSPNPEPLPDNTGDKTDGRDD